MSKLSKYKKQILMAVLLISGALFALLGQNFKVQGGGACVSWGLAVLVAVWINKQRQLQQLDDFDTEAQDVLQDIALNGEKSQYFQFYNIEIVNNLRKKMVKRQQKQTASCAILGVVLLLTAIICIV